MLRLVSFLLAVTLSVSAAAQSPPDPFEACAQKADSAARLACFDQEIQRRHASSALRAAPPEEASHQQALHEELPHQEALHQDGAAKARVEVYNAPQEQGVVKEPPKPIVAQVVRSMSRPDHRYTLMLDNGQVWEQVDSRPGLYIDAHETVTISSAALGSFFLETSKRQFLRVRRLL